MSCDKYEHLHNNGKGIDLNWFVVNIQTNDRMEQDTLKWVFHFEKKIQYIFIDRENEIK